MLKMMVIHYKAAPMTSIIKVEIEPERICLIEKGAIPLLILMRHYLGSSTTASIETKKSPSVIPPKGVLAGKLPVKYCSMY